MCKKHSFIMTEDQKIYNLPNFLNNRQNINNKPITNDDKEHHSNIISVFNIPELKNGNNKMNYSKFEFFKGATNTHDLGIRGLAHDTSYDDSGLRQSPTLKTSDVDKIQEYLALYFPSAQDYDDYTILRKFYNQVELNKTDRYSIKSTEIKRADLTQWSYHDNLKYRIDPLHYRLLKWLSDAYNVAAISCLPESNNYGFSLFYDRYCMIFDDIHNYVLAKTILDNPHCSLTYRGGKLYSNSVARSVDNSKSPRILEAYLFNILGIDECYTLRSKQEVLNYIKEYFNNKMLMDTEMSALKKELWMRVLRDLPVENLFDVQTEKDKWDIFAKGVPTRAKDLDLVLR